MANQSSPNGERLAIAGSALLLLSAFLPWATVEVLHMTTTANGLTGIGYLPPLAGLVVLWTVYTRDWDRFEMKVTTVAGALALGSVWLTYTSLEHVFAVGQPVNHIDVSPEIGLYATLVASGLVVLGGVRGLRSRPDSSADGTSTRTTDGDGNTGDTRVEDPLEA